MAPDTGHRKPGGEVTRGDSAAVPGPVARFCARLLRLQLATGIKQKSLADAAHLGTSQMSDILNGRIKRLPDWDVTAAVVRASLEHAERTGRPVPPDLRDESDWRRRYGDLEHDLGTEAAARSRPRREAVTGRQLAKETDPFALEVHRSLQPGTPRPGLPALPAYVRRDLDAELAEVVQAAAQGASGVAVLVGESSTGKTRACWEALDLLRERRDPWRLWHPLSAEEALKSLPLVGPRTVVWLNEIDSYLAAPGGEHVAAGLRDLVRDPARGPVLVLGTIWRDKLSLITADSRDNAHRHARKLLAGNTVSVPDAFSGADLDQLRILAGQDPRLAEALDAAEDHQVTQYLAGVPLLMERYRAATPTVRAVIHAAMDARRLGCGPDLPYGLLEDAAPGYLLSMQRGKASGKGWLDPVLELTAEPGNGIRGPVTPSPAKDGCYRLADYLEQYGTRERLDVLPPREFWDAVRGHAAPGDLPALAWQAETRGLYRQGARLRMHALAAGEDLWVFRLLMCLRRVDPHSLPEAAAWIAGRMDLSRPASVHTVLETLREAGHADLAGALAARAADVAGLADLRGVDDLLRDLHRFGRGEALAALADRAAGRVDPAHLDLHLLYVALWQTGAADAVRTLVARDPLRGRDLTDNTTFLVMLHGEGPGSPAMAAHAVRAAESVDLTQASKVCGLLRVLAERGFRDALAELLARWPADKVVINDPHALGLAMEALTDAGELDACQGLAERLAGQAALDAASVRGLLLVLRGEADAAADRLAERYAAHAPISDPDAHYALAWLHDSGTRASVATLARRLADSVDLADIRAVAELLDSLHEVGIDGLLQDRLEHVSLSRYEPADPAEVTHLLRILSAAGAGNLVRGLLDLNLVRGLLDLNLEAKVDVDGEHPGEFPPEFPLMALQDLLEELGEHEAAATIGGHIAGLHPPVDPRKLTWHYLSSDAPPTARMLARLTPQHAQVITLTDASAIAALISGLRRFGVDGALAVVLARLAEDPPGLGSARAVDSLLCSLPDTQEGRLAAERISRDSAEQAELTDASGLSAIIGRYHALGCGEPLRILVNRDPSRKVRLSSRPYAGIRGMEAYVHLDRYGVKSLIDVLRWAGEHDQAGILAARAANAGMFAADDDFAPLSLLDHGLEPADRYQYGRALDGRPSPPWGWRDLLRDEESVVAG